MLDVSTIVTSPDPRIRDQSLDTVCRGASARELLAACDDLNQLRRSSDNLYHRVRALFFLYAIHRFYLPHSAGVAARGMIPFEGYTHLLNRRFEEAISVFAAHLRADGPTDAISSALATAYHRLAFQTLADQVRRSVRSVRGNQWMFRVGHPADQPLRVRRELVGPKHSHSAPEHAQALSANASALRVRGARAMVDRRGGQRGTSTGCHAPSAPSDAPDRPMFERPVGDRP